MSWQSVCMRTVPFPGRFITVSQITKNIGRILTFGANCDMILFFNFLLLSEELAFILSHKDEISACLSVNLHESGAESAC